MSIKPVENPTQAAKVAQIFGALAATTTQRLERYSDEQLATIVNYLSYGNQTMRQQTAKLRLKEGVRNREKAAELTI